VLADDPPARGRQFFGVRETHQIDRARNLPGVDPRMDRPMLIKKSLLQPVLKNTARGGRKSARKYRHTSEVEDGMMAVACGGVGLEG
jgi:hypothetical protein